MTQEANILSSTGKLGYSRRTCDRGYGNIPGLSSAKYVERADLLAQQIIVRGSMSRMVLRTLMPESEIIRLDGAAALLEAAVPVDITTKDQERVWMCMFARNGTQRRAIISPLVMEEQTQFGFQKQNAVELVTAARDQGYRMMTIIQNHQIEQIYRLWTPVFGWSKEKFEVEGLRQRIDADQLKLPQNRSVWFTSLSDQGEIITLAMAERLEFPEIAIVELTEWVSNRRGRHLMKATVAYNIAQVLEDLSTLEKPLVLIAETNYITAAYRVSYGVGMRVPERRIKDVHVPQLLIQNVNIGDGASEASYRDFVMMYLPPQTIERQYGQTQRQNIFNGG